MTENKFGKISRLSIRTGSRDGKTILEDLSFTAPYKVMTPFPKEDGGISIMPLCASAGIMEGDVQEFTFQISEGSNLEFLSQSFDKVHKMKEGLARRSVTAEVKKNAVFCYYPQPVIPYAQSAFESDMKIHLEDESSRFFLMEIISCGRKASGERFRYRKYASKVSVWRSGSLIYRDNTRYEPEKMEDILKELEFYPASCRVKKTRGYYIKDHMTAAADKVENLGNFLELEIIVAKEEERAGGLDMIYELMRMLGCEKTETVRDSYLSMLEKRGV